MATQVMDDLLTNDKAQILVYSAGKTAKGEVIDANASRILLELPGGLTGMITKKEAAGYDAKTGDIEVGTEIEAFIIDPDGEQGLVMLSLRRASQEMVWAELGKSLDEQQDVKVKITEANRGGLIAYYKGIKAFLPVSQLTPLHYPRVSGADAGEILKRLQEHVGQEFTVRIINSDRENGKLIISEKAAHTAQSTETLKNLRVNDIIKGTVSGVVKFGIFVAFGGVEGLVHLSELDWGHISNPAKKYSTGDKVEVLIIGIDGEKLSLSVKRLADDPWKDKVVKYSIGDEVSGNVIRWNANGVFIEIEKDVPGIFPLEQFEVEDYSKLDVKEGQEMVGVIEAINYDSHRIELKKVEGKKTGKKK